MVYLAILLAKYTNGENMRVCLVRTESGPEGTFGKLIVAYKVFATAELPWEDNERDISCIPYGEYECKITDSHKFGKVYLLDNVDGRSHILMHWGNWAGDKSAGFMSDTEGCIIVGTERGVINKQKAVARSRDGLREFMELLDHKPFKLVVSGMDIW